MITFTSVFVILFFIFVLQGIWLFISELAGKDLDTFTVLKFLSFYAPTIVPLVLPLSILLASIMTFGDFAENYEFAAMKSSGISLQRAMKYLTVAIFLLSIVSFVFANNVIPRAQYKFLNLRNTIIQQRPAMAIAEGQFNKVGNYTIKVEKKSGKNGEILQDVTIHIKNVKSGLGANTVIKAKKGVLKGDESGTLLKMELFDGNYYENVNPKTFTDINKHPFVKSAFAKYIINIDLAKLYESPTDEGTLTTEKMLTISELNYTLDSLQKSYKNDVISYSDNIVDRNNFVFKQEQVGNLEVTPIATPLKIEKKPEFKDNDVLSLFNLEEKIKVLDLAKNNLTSNNFSIVNSSQDLQYKKKNINRHWVVIHEKFVLAYACLLLFFIGAPLGSIIKKGGLGLPIVFAIIIFITYHFMNLFGKKLAEEDAISPFLGTWMSSLLLTPLAIYLTIKATQDLGGSMGFNFEGIKDFFVKIFTKQHKKQNNVKPHTT